MNLLRRRPFNCGNQNKRGWYDRARIAAELLLPHLRAGDLVVDLGCGDQKFRTFLPPEVRYRGCDLIPQSEDVARLNLETEELEGGYDAAVLLGVLEYVANIEAILRKIRRVCPLLVVSHVVGDHPNFAPSAIRKLGWKTVLPPAEFEKEVSSAGWIIIGRQRSKDRLTMVWLLKDRP